MAVKRVQTMPGINGLAVGQTATQELPIGPRYHVIWICASSGILTAAQMFNEFRLKVNGKTQRVMSPTELEALNKLNGAQYANQTEVVSAGVTNIVRIPIFLAEPWRKQQAAQEGLAWATGDVATFQLEMDVKAGITVPTVYCVGEVDNSFIVGKNNKSQNQGLGLITKWYRQILPITGNSADITNLPRLDAYQSIHFIDPAITNVRVLVESLTIRDVLKGSNDATLTARDLVPVSAQFDLVFDHDDILNSALPMEANGSRVNDFQVKLTSSSGTARNIVTMLQRIGPAD